MLVGPTYDLVVYTNSVRENTEESEKISDDKKKEIISIVAKLLKSANIRTDFQA